MTAENLADRARALGVDAAASMRPRPMTAENPPLEDALTASIAMLQ